MVNIVYNMVHQHDSQAIDERIFSIKEILQHANMRNILMGEATSWRNQVFIPK